MRGSEQLTILGCGRGRDRRVAGRMGRSEAATRNLLSRALARLARLLRGLADDDGAD